MEFILVNYGLNQSFLVEKSFFEKMLIKIIKSKKNLELVKSKVVFFKNESVSFQIFLKIKKNLNVSETIESITNEIRLKVKNIINTFPKNISIFIEKVN